MLNKKILLFSLGVPLLGTLPFGFLGSFRCAASFFCGASFCAVNLLLIYWAWVYLLRRKKLALWSGFLVLKYGLVLSGLYFLLLWTDIACFSGGLFLEGLVVAVALGLFSNLFRKKEERKAGQEMEKGRRFV